jgi:O-antigen/teichoic acid export membrane protein
LFFSPVLTYLGQRIGFDAHGIAKDSALMTLAHIFSMLKGVVTGYLVTRLFPQEMYGSYRFALSIVGTLSFLSIPGFASTLATHIAQKKEKAHVSSALRIYALWCLGSSLLIASSVIFVWYKGRVELWPLLLVAAILFTPNSVGTNSFGALVRGENRFDTGFKITAISNVLQIIFVLLMLWLHQSPLLLLLCTTGISSMVYAFTVLKKAAQLSLVSIPTTLSWYADGLLVSYYFGLSQLALLSVAYLIPEQVKVWTKEIFPIAYARSAAGNDSPEKRATLRKIVGIGTLFFALGIGLYWVLSPIFLPMLFPQYATSDLVFLSSIAATTLIVGPATLFPQYLEARGKIKELHWCTWSASLAYVLSLLLLVPTYGVLGAILSRGAFRITYAVSGFVMFERLK